MISRKSTRLLTNLYLWTFSHFKSIGPRYRETSYRVLHHQTLYELLYERDYDVWVLGKFEKFGENSGESLRKFLLGLQTGETLHKAGEGRLEECLQYGQRLLQKLAGDIIHLYKSSHENYGAFAYNSDQRKLVSELKAQLELDGYIYRDGKIIPTDKSAVNEEEEQSYLESLINGCALVNSTLIKHHLELCEKAYIEARWGDAISNARNFLEAILEQIAQALHQKKNNLPLPSNVSSRPVEVRNYLEREGLIDSVERESLAKNYGLISNTGSHPNMAQKDQARLMRNLALTFSQYVLLQWEGYLKNNP